MKFGTKVRTTRLTRGMTQQELAKRMSVSVSYISKVENERLHFGDYPSEKFIHKLADELETDEDELLILADKVPLRLRQRIRERPSLFKAIAELDESSLEQLSKHVNPQG
jgi:HTH-type transcriptional regulator, competence development regulator